ncbi:MAG: hypothetical protein ACR2QO_07705 [Acidimicrobiales bacterium]
MALTDAIADYEAAALRVQPELLRRARDPVTGVADHFLAPLHLPDSIRAVAHWHDGGFEVPGVGEWFSLQRSVEHRAHMREFVRNNAAGWPVPMMPIPSQWFPIAAGGGTEWSYLVELTPEPRADSPIWRYDSDGGPCVVSNWSSVEVLFRIAAERIRTGDDGTSTRLDIQMDPGYLQHESVEAYPEDWPRRWDHAI